MRLFSLGGRLEAAAGFIPQNAKVADIGTDHCRLPVWLIMTGKIDRAIASDIRALPLERGRENCRKWGVEDKVELRLCDGLVGIEPHECTHVCICGMGGDNIIKILEAAPWTADGKHTLILQAETSARDLRHWLGENGFVIEDEKAVIDTGRVYSVMKVTAGKCKMTAAEEYMSAPLMRQHDKAARMYLGRVLRSIERELHGISPETPEFAEKTQIFEFFKEMEKTMPKVNDILAFMDAWAPVETKMSYDNVGLLVGDAEADVTKILVALDITPEVVDEAENFGAELIISHHPLIFHPFYNLTGASMESAAAAKLIKSGISAVCMHTNLDIAADGVSDTLAETLGLENITAVEGDEENVLRQGILPREMTAEDFARYVAQKLETPVKYVPGTKMIQKVAVCGGAGGGDDEYLSAKASGCDAYVSSEFKHNNLTDAKYSGFTVVDAGHFATEHPICLKIIGKIKEKFPGVELRLSAQSRPEEYMI